MPTLSSRQDIAVPPPRLGEEVRNCRILIVEDDPVTRIILKSIFSKHGFNDIEEAVNGSQALAKVRASHPALVITDVIMPEMDGLEFCAHIRADAAPHIAEIPILVQTSLSNASDKARIFAAGATDYILKPVDPQEIIARSVVHLEREIMMRRMRNVNARISQEMDIARHAQQVLIPTSDAIREAEMGYRLTICQHFRTCSELGGDIWGFRSLSSDKLAVYVVDFSNHGLTAALNVFRLHALMHNTLSVAHAPGAYLTHLNAVLATLLPPEQFATAFYGIIDTRTNLLTYACAAPTAPLILRADGTCQRLDPGGMLLGVNKDAGYRTQDIRFNAGDTLLLYSDALTETPDEKGDFLTEEHIAGFFGAQEIASAKNFRSAFERFLHHFQRHFAPRLTDDLTISSYSRLS